MSFTVYPAIDLRGGKVVRLKEGDPTRLTAYSSDPAGTARRWIEAGAGWLHVVSLDGAFGEEDHANELALRAILKLGARVQFGGGIRSLDAVHRTIELGVRRVVLGTIAVEQPDVVEIALTKFGAKAVAVGIDARDGFVRLRGWKGDSRITPLDLARQMRAVGLHKVIFTDISRDGLGSGLNIASARELAEASELEVIASGGIHTLDHVQAARDANLSGVIVGRALYEGTVDLKAALTVSSPPSITKSHKDLSL